MIWLPKDEYAAFCSAVRTINANKIPKNGLMLYRNHLYVYTYERYGIICNWQLEIEGNEDFIDKFMKKWEKKYGTESKSRVD